MDMSIYCKHQTIGMRTMYQIHIRLILRREGKASTIMELLLYKRSKLWQIASYSRNIYIPLLLLLYYWVAIYIPWPAMQIKVASKIKIRNHWVGYGKDTERAVLTYCLECERQGLSLQPWDDLEKASHRLRLEQQKDNFDNHTDAMSWEGKNPL